MADIAIPPVAPPTPHGRSRVIIEGLQENRTPWEILKEIALYPYKNPHQWLAMEYLWPGRRLRPTIWTGIRSPTFPFVSVLKQFKFFRETPLRTIVDFFSGNYTYGGLDKPIEAFIKRHIADEQTARELTEAIARKLAKIDMESYIMAGRRDVIGKAARGRIYKVIVGTMRERGIDVHRRRLMTATVNELDKSIMKRAMLTGVLKTVSNVAQVAGYAYLLYSIGKFAASTTIYAANKGLYEIKKILRTEFGSDISDFLTAIPLSERQRAQRAFSEARFGTHQQTYLGNEASMLYR